MSQCYSLQESSVFEIDVAKPNGWIRLWILLSAIWVCVLACDGYIFLPRQASAYRHWAHDTKRRIEDHQGNLKMEALLGDARQQQRHPSAAKSLSGEPSFQPVNVDPTRESIESAQARFRQHYPKSSGFKEINQRNESRLSQIRRTQVRGLKIFLLLAIVPPIVLYLLGYGVSWVRRGFAN